MRIDEPKIKIFNILNSELLFLELNEMRKMFFCKIIQGVQKNGSMVSLVLVNIAPFFLGHSVFIL